MTENRLLDYLDHIIDASQLAYTYIEGMDKDEFLVDTRTQQAVILNIVVIGEAATKLTKDYPTFTEQYSHVPWKNMKGMRNRIAHGYFDINLDIVCDTVQNALPLLVEQLEAVKGDFKSRV